MVVELWRSPVDNKLPDPTCTLRPISHDLDKVVPDSSHAVAKFILVQAITDRGFLILPCDCSDDAPSGTTSMMLANTWLSSWSKPGCRMRALCSRRSTATTYPLFRYRGYVSQSQCEVALLIGNHDRLADHELRVEERKPGAGLSLIKV